MANPIVPPFSQETARLKVQAAEDGWNSRDPERVALAYTEDSEWRNRDEFLRGREEIKAFLRRKWAKELDETGKPAVDKVFGMSFFDFLAQHADQGARFSETMVSVHG